MRRGLVEQQDAPRAVEERPRESDALRLPARERPRPLADARVQPAGQLVHEPLEPHHLHGARHLVVGRVRAVEHEVLAQRGVEEVGVLRDVGHLALPGRLAQASRPHAVHVDLALVGRGEAAEQAHERALARAACAHDAHLLEPLGRKRHALERLEPRVREAHALEPEARIGVPGGQRQLRRRLVGSVHERLDGRERVLAVERGVVVGRELADRTEVLGRYHEQRERREQRDRAVDQAESQHECHGRHRKRRERVQHQAREVRHLERAHGGLAEALGHLVDALPVALGHAEQLERVDAAQRVDEVVRHDLERAVLPRRLLLGRVAHDDHVQDDERERHEHDESRHPVECERGRQQNGGNEGYARDLGQDELEVRLHLVGALEHGSGHAAGAVVLHEPGIRGEYFLEQ